jgi:hypothetical protein
MMQRDERKQKPTQKLRAQRRQMAAFCCPAKSAA